MEDLQELVAFSDKVRALGSRHSFNAIADSCGTLVSLEHLRGVIDIDSSRQAVRVGGGSRYGDICRELHAQRWALRNLASLPHISVAGASTTATHGSGNENQCLSASVAGIELVHADGTLRTYTRSTHPDLFGGLVVGMGSLGICTAIELDLVPAFQMRQFVYRDLPFETLMQHFDEISSSAYSVSQFLDWTGDVEQVWLKCAPWDKEPQSTFFGATHCPHKIHPISSVDPAACTDQLGQPGPWYDRLPHFRMDHVPSAGEELQTEYLVPRQHCQDAMRALRALSGRFASLLLVSEIRTIAGDELWMSPFYNQPCVGFHFTWKREQKAVEAVLPLIEAQLLPLGAKPHWGKLFMGDNKTLESIYPRWRDYTELVREFDPRGKFANPWTQAVLGR